MNDTRLFDMIEIIGGGTPKRGVSEYWDGDIDWLSVKDFNNGERYVHNATEKITESGLNKSSTKLLTKGDLIISARGTVGCLAQLAKPMAFNQSCYGIRGNEELDNDFLYYWLKTKIVELQKNSHGAVFDTITTDTFKILSISLLPIAEQKAIASVLGALDDKIENNRRMNETLEAMAQALFKDWFVDFGPVHAKAAGKKPAHMDAKTAALFPSTFGDDGLPEGWKLWSLGEMTEKITKGTTPSKKDLMKVGQELSVVNFLKVNNISNICYFNKKPFEKIPTSIHENQLKRSILEVDHILYSIAGTIGRVIIIDGEILPANTNQALAILKPQKAVCPTGYLRLILSNSNFQAKLNSNVVQGVQANLGLSIISAQMFVFPPAEIINQIFSTMDNLLRLQKNNFKQSQTLAEMRDLLLPRLMSGQLRVAATGQKNGE